MKGILRDSFVFSAFAGNEAIERTACSADEVLATLDRLDAWREGSIHPANGADFPRVELSYHQAHGFVVQCFEDDRAWSDFLVTGEAFSRPAHDIELGGQALERWPAELFVPRELAIEAIEWFFKSGKQKPILNWVRIDKFPREIVWSDRAGRSAWERTRGARDDA